MEAINILEKLEASDTDIDTQTSRNLQALYTPEAKKSILPTFKFKHVLPSDIEMAIKKVQKETWINFHWNQENTVLEANLGMRMHFLRTCALF